MATLLNCAERQDTTELLELWSRGDDWAGERVLARLYPSLRALARGQLRSVDVSLQPSDVLQEVWMRLVVRQTNRWQNRAHFFALVARAIRRVLADKRKATHRRKRGGARRRETIDPDLPDTEANPIERLSLDQALEELADLDPITARCVELRYFAGLSFEEVAAVLEIGRTSAVRRWRFARAWLFARLRPRGEEQ